MSMNKKLATLLLLGFVVSTVPSCVPYGRGRVGIGFTYVDREPPPVREEVITASPGPEYVWTNGYWSWSGAEYVWVGGRWARPDAGHREWVAHRWEHDSHGWHMIEGHWR